jgi:hypothetical protein
MFMSFLLDHERLSGVTRQRSTLAITTPGKIEEEVAMSLHASTE